MYSKPLVLLLLLFVSTSIHAQALRISGRVVNTTTQQPIPYANIGIAGKAIGTVATASGDFAFTVKEGQLASTDKLVASCVGYESMVIALDAGKLEVLQISLKPQVVEIAEVKVQTGKPRKKVLGKDDRAFFTHYNFYTVHDTAAHDRLGREVGNFIKLSKACYVNDFNVYVGWSEFTSVKFRLNIYDVVDDLPGESLLQEDVIFEAKGSNPGWVQVDLKGYNILLEGHDQVAVTVQWLESVKQKDGSRFLAVPAAISPVHSIVRRDKSAAGWKKSGGYLSMYLNADCY
ncbi:carboxypeptidase-like protein [Pontibacter mucosus]|uniref:Carboxypeptidase-like protein n=1 Tax=Pontibacter mucosus TaxID=1649266 RepID=A0A2T5Y7E5_9BACT|nr:carboxypeptidase-like regulatory domain-containing protein [Pontibacter mucosus]PTX12242.1 carboxypeptidase-like protein [Pontibacter mucosus]